MLDQNKALLSERPVRCLWKDRHSHEMLSWGLCEVCSFSQLWISVSVLYFFSTDYRLMRKAKECYLWIVCWSQAFHQCINLVLFNVLQKCIYWSVFYFPSSRDCLELHFQYLIFLSSWIVFLFRILRHWILDTFCLIFISIHFYECICT